MGVWDWLDWVGCGGRGTVWMWRKRLHADTLVTRGPSTGPARTTAGASECSGGTGGEYGTRSGGQQFSTAARQRWTAASAGCRYGVRWRRGAARIGKSTARQWWLTATPRGRYGNRRRQQRRQRAGTASEWREWWIAAAASSRDGIRGRCIATDGWRAGAFGRIADAGHGGDGIGWRCPATRCGDEWCSGWQQRSRQRHVGGADRRSEPGSGRRSSCSWWPSRWNRCGNGRELWPSRASVRGARLAEVPAFGWRGRRAERWQGHELHS